jgi:translation initiation factor 1A
MKSQRSASKQATTRREVFERKQDGQVYGLVTRALGDGKFECTCDDHVTRTCTIRGNMRNRVYVRIHDVVLINLYVGMNQDGKGIISYRYSPDQVREIQAELNFQTEEEKDETSFDFI